MISWKVGLPEIGEAFGVLLVVIGTHSVRRKGAILQAFADPRQLAGGMPAQAREGDGCGVIGGDSFGISVVAIQRFARALVPGFVDLFK